MGTGPGKSRRHGGPPLVLKTVGRMGPKSSTVLRMARVKAERPRAKGNMAKEKANGGGKKGGGKKGSEPPKGGCFICGGKHWASECAQNAFKKGGGQPKAGEQGRHLEEEMKLCCMRSCAPETGGDDVGYPMVPSSTKPCGAKTMPATPCQQRTMEKKVRKGSSCEQNEGNVGANGERGLPMDPRNTTTPHNEEVEGPQRRVHDAASGCDKRAGGRSFEKPVRSHKRGTPPGGENVAEGHSARLKVMPMDESILSEYELSLIHI